MKSKKLTLSILLSGLTLLANAANIAMVPKDAPGNTATAGAGKQWPTTRFVADVSGNCMTDNLTGLMWAKNANLLGTANWSATAAAGSAQDKVAQMNGTTSSATGYHLCGYIDWRLPNQNELLSLLNYTNASQVAWLEGSGFTNVSNYYWSATDGGYGAWYVNMANGTSGSDFVFISYYVWPVRGGL